MKNRSFPNRRALFAAGLSAALVCGCSSLRDSSPPSTTFYSLDNARVARPATAAADPMALPAKPVLIVNPPHAASGYDSQRIIYARQDHKLEYFSRSEWVDTPARMLAPLIVAAVQASGAFGAVALTPSAAAADLRLDTEVVLLRHEFDTVPSRVRFTLRAYLVDSNTRRVLAWREIDSVAPAPSEDPYGGVVAANIAVGKALETLAAFCAETARTVRVPASPKTSD